MSTWVGLHVDVGPRHVVADGALALHGDALRGRSRVAVTRSRAVATTRHAHGSCGQGALHRLLHGHVTGTCGGWASGAGPVSTSVSSGQLWGGRRLTQVSPRSSKCTRDERVPLQAAGLHSHWVPTGTALCIRSGHRVTMCAWWGLELCSLGTVTPGRGSQGHRAQPCRLGGPHRGSCPCGCLRDRGTGNVPCKPAHHCRSGPA